MHETVAYPMTLEPAETRRVSRRVNVAQILGDSLPPGSYRVRVAPAVTSNVPIPTQFQELGVFTLQHPATQD